MITESYTQQRE